MEEVVRLLLNIIENLRKNRIVFNFTFTLRK